MAQRETYLTPEGQKSLEEELEHLSTVRRSEVAARIHKASETGGTVDNAEYDEAKNEQAFVEGRISDLENILYKRRGDSEWWTASGSCRVWLVGHRHLRR